MPQLHKIAIIGCGNWGSAICRIVGENAVKFPDLFDKCVRMWVFEELVDGKKLSEIINNEHVNRKYLPDVKLPENVLAVPDLVESAKDATILIFAIPHQFVAKTCKTLSGKIREDAIGVSLIKGLSASPDGSARLISSEVRDLLNGKIEIAVLMGANLANEVAEDQFCEATIEEVEKELLNGQKLQGPATAAQASEMIERANLLDEFPLFVAVHKVCKGQFKPEQMLDHIRSFPVESMID